MGCVIATVASAMWPAIVAALIVELAKGRNPRNGLPPQGARSPTRSKPSRTELTFQLRVSLTARRDQPQTIGDAKEPEGLKVPNGQAQARSVNEYRRQPIGTDRPLDGPTLREPAPGTAPDPVSAAPL